MRIYTVHAAPGGDGTAAADPDRFVFIKEGFSWPALLVPELWLLYRRMWLIFVLFVAASVGLAMLVTADSEAIVTAILVLARLWFATEANGLRRWTLERRGYRLIGVAEGHRLSEAEFRFFSGWLESGRRTPPAPVEPPAKPPQAETAAPSPAAGEVIGLFPNPGGGL
jgi:hypothetical protein